MITITIDDRAILAVLNDLRGRLDDLTPVMDAVGMEMETRVSRRFEDETDPVGALWKPWSPATRARYPKSGNGRLLDRTGDMLDSLNYQADRDSVTVGFGAPYAAFHEYGTKHMPRRGLLLANPGAGILGDEDQRSILAILSNYLSPAS